MREHLRLLSNHLERGGRRHEAMKRLWRVVERFLKADLDAIEMVYGGETYVITADWWEDPVADLRDAPSETDGPWYEVNIASAADMVSEPTTALIMSGPWVADSATASYYVELTDKSGWQIVEALLAQDNPDDGVVLNRMKALKDAAEFL